jgi:hypothetical protein
MVNQDELTGGKVYENVHLPILFYRHSSSILNIGVWMMRNDEEYIVFKTKV